MAVTKVPEPYISSDYTQWERKKRPATSYNTTIHHLSSLCQIRKQQCFTASRGTTASRPLDSEHTRLLKVIIIIKLFNLFVISYKLKERGNRYRIIVNTATNCTYNIILYHYNYFQCF